MPIQKATLAINDNFKNIKESLPPDKDGSTKDAALSATGLVNKKMASQDPSTPPKANSKIVASVQAGSVTKMSVTSATVGQLANSDTLKNSPSGAITTGYNCIVNFETTLDYKFGNSKYDLLVWYIVFEDIGGNYNYLSDGYKISSIVSVKKPLFESKTIGKWPMIFDIYAKCTYPTARFKVVVQKYMDGNPVVDGVVVSDIVTVNFDSTQNCVYIHDMGLTASNSDGGYPSIKGGDHDTEPTVYINLNSPAPPDGQSINFEITQANSANAEAWINPGAGQLTIGGGQTHGEWSGVVGSRKVAANKDVHVKATVNGVPAVATLRITKK